ncbi:MAG: hypothetical protein AB1813_20700 [Verrucomicrobiota bacterium]
MRNRSAIHCTVIAVSARSRSAIATFCATPLVRPPNSPLANADVQFFSHHPFGMFLHRLLPFRPIMHLPVGFGACFLQRADKPLPIRVIAENRLAPVTAIQDMVNGLGIFNSKFARHGQETAPATPI